MLLVSSKTDSRISCPKIYSMEIVRSVIFLVNFHGKGDVVGNWSKGEPRLQLSQDGLPLIQQKTTTIW